ncbi:MULTISPECIES: HDOD domain-containing protein [Methylomonas]|uniref:HDOD domain-containing protein n=1 Tax=Methylomonas TaxID=416 RepID=UPI001231F6D5|nr:HDOD domain-containing protein [Methylomonas rhizoryzae]
MSASIEKLFDNLHKLPQVPEVVRTLINQLNDPHAELLDIVKTVEKEQVIALKVLRLVNSAHFGLSRKVGSLSEAVLLIGMGQLKTLVIASGLVASVPSLQNFDLRKFWSTSFRAAEYAKWFAARAGVDADVAFTAGLIGGMGKLLIHMAYPSESNEIEQHAKAGHLSRPDVERKRIGFTNQQACAELFRRWKFADELIDAINQSAEPLTWENPSALAYVVHLAQFISYCIDCNMPKETIEQNFPYPVAEKLGLDRDAVDADLCELLLLESPLEDLAA